MSGVRILQMQDITKRHQSDEERNSVFLHEFAHAFHDLVLGFDNESVKNAYRQAMERKLYDKSSYLTTNEKEYFAELTCAYLDNLDYFPHNREELKKHDPLSHKLLETIWGRRKDEKITGKEKPSSKSKFSLEIDLTSLKLGTPLAGPTVTAADLKGRVVLISFWEPSWPDASTSLQKLQSWNDELGEYGLVVLSEASWGAPKAVPIEDDRMPLDKIRASGTSLPHFFNGTLKGLDDVQTYPHAVLFDADGRCVFRGSPFAAEAEIRAAIGKAIVAAAGVDTFTLAMMSFVESLQKGSPPAAMLPKLLAFYRNNSGASAEQAKAVIKQLTAPGQKRLDDAEKLAKSDPLAAYERIENVPAAYKNTQVAAKATALMAKLKQDKTVAAEVRAKPSLDAIKKIDTTLSGRPGSFAPLRDKFQDENADVIGQLKESIEKMKRAHGKSKAYEQAAAIGHRYGIESK